LESLGFSVIIIEELDKLFWVDSVDSEKSREVIAVVDNDEEVSVFVLRDFIDFDEADEESKDVEVAATSVSLINYSKKST